MLYIKKEKKFYQAYISLYIYIYTSRREDIISTKFIKVCLIIVMKGTKKRTGNYFTLNNGIINEIGYKNK